MSGAPDYHGWTHRSKEDGGTDPIPGLVADPIDFSYITQEGDQTDPLPSGAEYNPVAIGPMTEAYTTDPSVLLPDLDNGWIEVLKKGFYIAASDVAGWDNWSGGGTDVLDAVKGSAVLWQGPGIDDRDQVSGLKPPTGTSGVPDSDSTTVSMNVLRSTIGQHVNFTIFQYSGVDALIATATLWVARLRHFDSSEGTFYFPS